MGEVRQEPSYLAIQFCTQDRHSVTGIQSQRAESVPPSRRSRQNQFISALHNLFPPGTGLLPEAESVWQRADVPGASQHARMISLHQQLHPLAFQPREGKKRAFRNRHLSLRISPASGVAAAGRRFGQVTQVLRVGNIRSRNEHISSYQCQLNFPNLRLLQLPGIFPSTKHGAGQLPCCLAGQRTGIHHPAGYKGLPLGSDVSSREQQVGYPILVQTPQNMLCRFTAGIRCWAR